MTAADRWTGALRASSRRLRHAVADLPPDRLAGPSFAAGWTIGQVLSHLGSGAEICTTLVERGLKGDERGPVREELLPVWERWDVMSPIEQRAAWLEADERHLALLDSLDAGQRTSLRVPYFAGLLDLASYAGYRLSEQAVHAWDVMVALDERAVLAAPDVVLLWERIDLVATRFRNADALTRLAPQRVEVQLTDPQQTLFLDVDTELHLYPTPATDPTALLTGPAESVLRLIYGRNRPQDPLTATGSITLDDLRMLFPGF
ncbi:maleylpyruvate isomerase family mycothiol-dependent enzyme [Streptomyces sp. NPDC058466]|uniref:maleylpyruvate isomerase family mycothiol-dependent enzyme n=1 Tax=Streptomyces sp. NPDC058466 TaxID=3346512 RepID=UPI00364A2D2B